nr:5'-nucleotidase C-terminal domain-containing protein [Chelativorans sp.]
MKRFAVLALSASALALSAAPSFADFTLNILHINDWHSRIQSINAFDSTCSEEDETAGECFGGAARLVTALSDRRAALEGQNVLFLNAGDNFQGSLFYTTYKGDAEAEFLNLMKPDAMAVGNHEFDDGEEGLAAFLDKVQFPVLGANVETTEASRLGDRVKDHVILDVGGQKIGIVSVVANDTAELASPGENVSITNDVEALTAAVKAVQDQGVNKILALTHVGYPRDVEALAKIPGVDVVVGGHSHTLLSNTAEGAAGPYPTMVDNPEGYKVPVVQAGAYSKYLGDLKLVFDDNGVVKEATGDVHLIDAKVEPDATVAARVKELAGPIEELKAQVVSETSAAIDGSRETCRAGECQMGNLVTDAMLARTKDQGVQFAITNGGGLRASIDQGEVTMGEVLEVLPFQNTLATFQLKGSDVVASLESGVGQIEEGAGRFPQVSGLRYTFDKSVAAGQGRIKQVEVQAEGGWEPIDPNATYTIATNNFMRNGGDGYALFAQNGQNAYDFGPGLEQVVADYLAANNPYKPYTDGRITEVSAPAEQQAAAPAEQPASTAPATAAGEQAPATTQPAAETAAGAEATDGAAAPDVPAAQTTEQAPAAATESAATEAGEGGPAAISEAPAAGSAGQAPTPTERPSNDTAAPDPTPTQRPAGGAAVTGNQAPAAGTEAAQTGQSGTTATAETPAATTGDQAPPATQPAGETATAGAEATAGAAGSDTPAAQTAEQAPAAGAEGTGAGQSGTATTAEAPAATTGEQTPAAGTSTETAAAEPRAGTEPAQASPVTTHVIAAGDTYWDLAEEFYGDPTKWRTLAEANPQLRAGRLIVGSTITVPRAE